MKFDPDNYAAYGIITVGLALAIACLAFLCLRFAMYREEAAVKLACQARGWVVLVDKDGEWRCSGPAAERAP